MKAPCIGMQGKMLPSVTSEDNGDVLTVVDGEWQKASGGGGNFVVIATIDIDTMTVSLDKNFTEIFTAAKSGVLPYVIISEEETQQAGEVSINTLSAIEYETGEEYSVTFGTLLYSSDSTTGTLTASLN